MDKYTNKHKRQLFSKINALSKTEHEEIYKILKKHNTNNPDSLINFSKNKNGIFFNLSDIDDVLFEELDNFVTYCINNKKDLDDYDKKINECKINNNYNNIIHINPENNIAKEESNQEKPTEDWNNIIVDPKSVQRVANYVEKLMADRDRIGKKKINAKFNNARKKFAKKVISDKKIDVEGFKDLECEPYLVST